MNFYNFAKMGLHDTSTTKKRLKKHEPSKWKHKLFNQYASLAQIRTIVRSTVSDRTKTEMVNELHQAKKFNRAIGNRIERMKTKIHGLNKHLQILKTVAQDDENIATSSRLVKGNSEPSPVLSPSTAAQPPHP